MPTLLVLAIVAVAAAGAYVVRTPTLLPRPSSDVVPVARGDVTSEVRADGAVASATSTTISFAADGTVVRIAATPGTRVSRGDVLASLDDGGVRPRVTAATATLAADTAALLGARLARPPDPVAWARLEAAVAADRAALADAQRALDATALVAPQDGTVTDVAGRVGERVSDDTEGARGFLTLSDLTDLVVRVSVDPREVPRLAFG